MLLTTTEVARMLCVAPHKVTYAIKTMDMIPAARAGIIRLFDETQAGQIRERINEIESRRRPAFA